MVNSPRFFSPVCPRATAHQFPYFPLPEKEKKKRGLRRKDVHWSPPLPGPPMIFGYVAHTFLFPYTNCSLIQSHDIFGERRWGSRPHIASYPPFLWAFSTVSPFSPTSETSFGWNSPRFCIFFLREITPWHHVHLRFLFCRIEYKMCFTFVPEKSRSKTVGELLLSNAGHGKIEFFSKIIIIINGSQYAQRIFDIV